MRDGLKGLAIILGMQIGCSAGTEIGNGVKPKPKQEDPSTKTEGSPQKPNETGKNSDPGPAPDTANDGGFALKLERVVNALLAPCASPFSEDLQSPFHLERQDVAADTGELFDAKFDASTKTWTILNSAGAAIRRVTPAGTTPWVVEDATDGIVVDRAYSCTTPAITDNVTLQDKAGTFRRVGAAVTYDDNVDEVIWYLAGAAPYKLVRVIITPQRDSQGSIVLDSEVKAPERPLETPSRTPPRSTN